MVVPMLAASVNWPTALSLVTLTGRCLALYTVSVTPSMCSFHTVQEWGVYTLRVPCTKHVCLSCTCGFANNGVPTASRCRVIRAVRCCLPVKVHVCLSVCRSSTYKARYMYGRTCSDEVMARVYVTLLLLVEGMASIKLLDESSCQNQF
jgi:hypothetical protein